MNCLIFHSLHCSAHCSRKEDLSQFPCVLEHEDDFQCESVEEVMKAPKMEDSNTADKTQEDLNITESQGMRYADYDGEETLEMTMEDIDIQNNKTQANLNVTESLGMRYEDDEETYEFERERSEREKPDGFTVIICWLGLAYTGLHTIYSAKSQ